MCAFAPSLAFLLLLAASAAADPDARPSTRVLTAMPSGTALAAGAPAVPLQPAGSSESEECLGERVPAKRRDFRSAGASRIVTLAVSVCWPGRAGFPPDRPAAFPFPPQAGRATGVSTSVPPPAEP